MKGMQHFECEDQHLLLTGSRTVFWEEEKTLILSDLHLGKTGHFRKSGIAVPQTLFKEDLFRLLSQIQFFKPRQVLVVGDFFHSSFNKELDLFSKWRVDISHTSFVLVAGNHDILSKKWYEKTAIEYHEGMLELGKFSFVHDINDCGDTANSYCFSGHIHPGVRISGAGRQSITLPCFYFSKHYAVLPAFGKFTGTALIKPQNGDHVFAIVNEVVMEV